MENLTAIYIWSIYQLRNRTTDGFLHDLGEDFGIMKIRLGHISSIYGISVCHSTCTGLKLEIRESKVCTTRI